MKLAIKIFPDKIFPWDLPNFWSVPCHFPDSCQIPDIFRVSRLSRQVVTLYIIICLCRQFSRGNVEST